MMRRLAVVAVLVAAGCAGLPKVEDPGQDPLPLDHGPGGAADATGELTEDGAPTFVWKVEPAAGHIDITAPQDAAVWLRPLGGDWLPAGPGRVGFLRSDAVYDVRIESAAGIAEERVRTLPGIGWAAEPLIQPASLMWPCPISFILQDGTNESLYALTAGHCPGDVGDPKYVRVNGTVLWTSGALSDQTKMGVVVATRNTLHEDWKLVRIDDAVRPYVSPRVLAWTGPTGHDSGMEKGQTVCVYGYGQTWDAMPLRDRCSGFDYYLSNEEGVDAFRFGNVGIPGDSGGPVIDYETGEALGYMVSAGASSTTALSLCYTLHKIREAGFDLALSTGTYDPPMAKPGLPTSGLPGPGPPNTLPCDQWPPRVLL